MQLDLETQTAIMKREFVLAGNDIDRWRKMETQSGLFLRAVGFKDADEVRRIAARFGSFL